jgi:predicted DNA-binding protein (UPF0251 family)
MSAWFRVNLMSQKKAQYASNAAAFVAILTVLIILYILFLPPDIRTDLLGDRTGKNVNGTGSTDTSVLLKQNVGLVNYINTNEKVYDLPATRILSPTSGQILKSVPSISLLHALFDREKAKYDIDFNINKAGTKNVLLSFNIREHKGPISVVLNDREIFSSEITATNPKPIVLDTEYLSDTNRLSLIVPSPGWAFWSVNKYSLENLQITGDVTDYSNSEAVQYFSLSQTERDNLEAIRLYFYPNCNFKDTGALRIDLNKRTIYNSIADCGSRTFAALNKNDLLTGSNELRFSSTKGSYTLDNMYVKVTMSKPAYRTYFFELKDDYFNVKTNTARCGDYDGTCPSGCDETVDADCCFSRNGFWCSLPTLNANDRCRFYVATDDCNICKTGFYDSYSNAPTNCQNKYGDNTDNLCPANTPQPSKYYDKDCCFAASVDNYWCKEVPVTGIVDKCKPSIAPSECELCSSGYVKKDGSRPLSCNVAGINNNNDEDTLMNSYEVKMFVRFVDGSKRKRVDMNVNGHTFRIDTTSIEYSKVISDFSRRGTNSIEIVPVETDVDIAEIRVEFKQVR